MVEQLETRRVLAPLVVSTLVDENDGDFSAGDLSLREAIEISQSNGSGGILFDPALTAAGDAIIDLTLSSSNEFGSSAIVISSGTIVIRGPSGNNGITIRRPSESADYRLFQVSSFSTVIMENLTLSGGVARGENGNGTLAGGGGGGGAGMGGAFFNQGDLTLRDVTLTDNQALGGKGGPSIIEDRNGGGGRGGGPAGGSGGQLSGRSPGGPGSDGGIASGGGGGGGFGEQPGIGGAGGNGGFGGGGGGGGQFWRGGGPFGAAGQGGFGAGNGLGPHGGGGAGMGGAIYNEARLNVQQSTLSGNTAMGGVGGQSAANSGAGLGGAIFNINSSAFVVNQSTIASNVVSGVDADGGGIFSIADAATQGIELSFSIVADSVGGADDLVVTTNAGGTHNSFGGGNLLESQRGYTGSAISGDPELLPLSDYGGPTATHALAFNSRATDASGIDGSSGFDQRGAPFSRQFGPQRDVGAFEFAPESPVVAPTLLTIARHSPQSANTNADLLVFRMTFDEIVVGVTASSFEIDGTTTATITNVASTDHLTYDVTVSGGDLASINSTIGLNLSSSHGITDASGNALPSSEPGIDEVFRVDNLAPTYQFIRLDPASETTNADTLKFQATFSEAVGNVDAFDFAVSGGTTASVSQVTSVSSLIYQITVSGGDLAGFDGTIGIDLSNVSDIADAAGNALVPSQPPVDETYIVDNVAPTLLSFSQHNPAFGMTSADSLVFRATFDEDVIGVDSSDFQVDGSTSATITNFQSTGATTYDITVSGGDLASVEGIVGLNLSPTNNIVDRAGNALRLAEPPTDEAYRIVNQPILTVDTLADIVDRDFSAGNLSLREAILFANSNPDANTIRFDNSLSGGTIGIGSQLPAITQPLTIQGLGSRLLTIDAGNGTDNTFNTADGYRIFVINDSSLNVIEVTITGLTLAGGDVNDEAGGAIFARENLTLDDVALNSNATNDRGGAIFTSEARVPFSTTLTITNSSFVGNHSGIFGGALYVGSSSTNINDSLFSGNHAVDSGGAMINLESVWAMSNVTVSNNSAGQANPGYLTFTGSETRSETNINFSTFAGNRVGNTVGNAIASSRSKSFQINNSIVQGPVFLGAESFPSGSYNLFSSTVPISGTGNLQNINAMLGPLQDNQGQTLTHALLSGSPAIDSANPAAVPGVAGTPPFDQRGPGFSRVRNFRADIGAFESDAAPALLSFARQTPSVELTNADTLVFRATFDEDVTNADISDFTVSGGSTAIVSNVVSVDGRTYDLTVSGGDLAGYDGTVGVDVAINNNIVDAGGSPLIAGEPAIDQTYQLENTKPTLLSFTRQNPASEFTTSDTLVFRLSFDEDVTGVDITDFVVSGASTAFISGISSLDARTYELFVLGGNLPDFNGVVGIDISPTTDVVDSVGNPMSRVEPPIDQTYTVDNLGPQVESIAYGDGSAQRSIIRSITVNFDSEVTVDPGAFVLTTQSGTAVSLSAPVLSVVNGKTRAVLTFAAGANVDATGSLVDGNYRLTILDTHVSDRAGNGFDGNNDGVAGGNATDDFFRFYGDVDGDRDVDFFDFIAFRRSFGKSPGQSGFDNAFDKDNDGDVDFFDFIDFRSNFGRSL